MLKLGVLVTPVQVTLKQEAEGMSIVTDWLLILNEFASKYTLSFDPGIPTPPVPPEVDAQCPISLQFPELPTQ